MSSYTVRLRQISGSSDVSSKMNHFQIFGGDLCLWIFDTFCILYINIDIFVQKSDQKDNQLVTIAPIRFTKGQDMIV